MTTPRLARVGRSRFFIGILLLILMIGFVAIFHSSQQQVDELRQLRLRCEQQQEVLNSRMQAIIEHKFRLEKSLETERKDHLETKHALKQKNKEQQDIHAKASLELNVRFDSLQQQHKLLQSEHNDLVEECTKTTESHMEQINSLERKVKSLQAQLQQSNSQRQKDHQSWKAKYESLESEKQRVELLTRSSKATDLISITYKQKVSNLERTLDEYKKNCPYRPLIEKNLKSDNFNTAPYNGDVLAKPVIEKSFNFQETVSDGLYKIPINLSSSINTLHASSKDLTIGDGANIFEKNKNGIIINSVENFQIAQKPLLSGSNNNNGKSGNKDKMDGLQQPPPLRIPLKSSTSASDVKISENYMKRALPKASSFQLSSTSEKMKRPSSTVASDKNKEANGHGKLRALPVGVAPVPDNFDALLNNNNNEELNKGGKEDGNGNNRYANVLEELSGKKDDPEKDNAAHEVKDNDFNIGDERIGNSKDHLQEVLDNVNNAAEEDTNNLFEPKLVGRPNRNENRESNGGVDIVARNKHEGDSFFEGEDNKLINEVVGDQGKEAAFPEGVHLEEGIDEDEDDDYSNPSVRKQQGIPVRN